MTVETLTPRLRQELIAALERERERLAQSMRALTEAVSNLSSSQGEEGDSGGASADVASDLAEEAVDLALAGAQRQRAAEVEQALHRVAEGSYGLCERCGQPIGVERLYALPWAKYCVACARLAEAAR